MFDPAEVCRALVRLDDQTLWASDARREIVRVLVERWPDFDEAFRASIEARLRQGLPETLYLAALTGDVTGQIVSDHETLKVLGPIRAAGHRLASETLEALQAMEERLGTRPDPGLDVAEPLGGLVYVRGHPERLRELSDDEVLGEALRLQASDRLREGKVWALFCHDEPSRALRALRASPMAPAAWPPEVLDSFLRENAPADAAREQRQENAPRFRLRQPPHRPAASRTAGGALKALYHRCR